MDRILIIEDEKQMAQMLSDYLKANDFDTDIAYDGFSAVRHISEEDYNLILMDVMIPDMDGFDVLKILRRNKNTPVIFLTARTEEAGNRAPTITLSNRSVFANWLRVSGPFFVVWDREPTKC